MKTELDTLIEEYKNLMRSWNGKDLIKESKIQELAALISECGFDVDDLEGGHQVHP